MTAERASRLISLLGLMPHPEGGHFREVFRSSTAVKPEDGSGRGRRCGLTTIYFLLRAGEFSCWHRVMSDEAWHLLEGGPLELHLFGPEGYRCEVLGHAAGQTAPIAVAPAGCWQAARPAGEFSLAGCAVGPGFEFADFAMLRDDPALAESILADRPELRDLL